MWPREAHLCLHMFLPAHRHVTDGVTRACLVYPIPKLMLTVSMAHYPHNYVKWEVSKWDYNFEMDSRCDQKATEL